MVERCIITHHLHRQTLVSATRY